MVARGRAIRVAHLLKLGVATLGKEETNPFSLPHSLSQNGVKVITGKHATLRYRNTLMHDGYSATYNDLTQAFLT